jgi:hypothetical protein
MPRDWPNSSFGMTVSKLNDNTSRYRLRNKISPGIASMYHVASPGEIAMRTEIECLHISSEAQGYG